MAALLELMTYNNEFLLDSGGDFILYDDGAGLNCCCLGGCSTCYNQFPDELTATFTASDTQCTCLNGAPTMTLQRYDAGVESPHCLAMGIDEPSLETRWSGTATICGYEFCLCLRPCENVEGGESCAADETAFSLHISSSAGCGAGGVFESDDVCILNDDCDSPSLEFNFSNAVVILMSGDCSLAMGTSLIITITP